MIKRKGDDSNFSNWAASEANGSGTEWRWSACCIWPAPLAAPCDEWSKSSGQLAAWGIGAENLNKLMLNSQPRCCQTQGLTHFSLLLWGYPCQEEDILKPTLILTRSDLLLPFTRQSGCSTGEATEWSVTFSKPCVLFPNTFPRQLDFNICLTVLSNIKDKMCGLT